VTKAKVNHFYSKIVQ